jgi:hypothetical protein
VGEGGTEGEEGEDRGRDCEERGER